MTVDLGTLSLVTKGCSPGPIVEPLVGTKVLRECYAYC
jgi:hypothetical protein